MIYISSKDRDLYLKEGHPFSRELERDDAERMEANKSFEFRQVGRISSGSDTPKTSPLHTSTPITTTAPATTETTPTRKRPAQEERAK